MKYSARAFLLLLLSCALSACNQSASKLPVIHMQIASEKFTLEIAGDKDEQAHGLMDRDSLNEDHGMIFPSSTESVRTYWNHHVHFPLDLLFLDSSGKIVSIQHMQPFSETNTSSVVPAKYVIELLGGTTDRIHIANGAKLELPARITSGKWPD